MHRFLHSLLKSRQISFSLLLLSAAWLAASSTSYVQAADSTSSSSGFGSKSSGSSGSGSGSGGSKGSKVPAVPTLQSEKPMLDSSAPKAPPAAPPSPPPPQQSPSGYFIPPDVSTSGQPPSGYGGGQPNYGAPPQNQFPAFPTENSIPEFGKPLPSVPSSGGGPNQYGQGWATGPTQSPDDARVARLEKAVLGSTYPEHDLIDRLEHLEEEVYKSKGTGATDDRLKKLENTVFGQSGAAFGQGSQLAASPPPSRPPVSQSAPPQPPVSQPPAQATGRAPYQLAPYPAGQGQTFQPSQPNIYGTSNGMPPGAPPQTGYSGPPPNYGVPYQGGVPQNYGQSGYAPQYGAPGARPPQGFQPYGGAPSGGGYQGQPNYQQQPYGAGAPGYGAPPAMGQAPYAPPGQLPYGAPQQPQPYGYRPPANSAPAMPPAQAAYVDPESQRIVAQINANPQAGDYFATVRKFQNGTVARWRHFPVLVHLPPNTPEPWLKNLNEDIKKWSALIPLKTAADYESFVVDVKWENKLPPRVLGITRVEGSGAGLKVVVFLLRPTFYPPDVPENTLGAVFLHELGHAVGLYGHSNDASDVMYSDDKPAKKTPPKATAISPRDMNTLKKVYSTPPIADSFVIQPPLEYNYREERAQDSNH